MLIGATDMRVGRCLRAQVEEGTSRLCGEELRGLCVHLVWCAFERSDAEKYETDEDRNLENYPYDRPDVCSGLREHDRPLGCVRVVSLVEVLVVRDVPCQGLEHMTPINSRNFWNTYKSHRTRCCRGQASVQ